MKHFSAQYIFTNAGPPLKRGIISASDDGTIAGIEDTGGKLVEKEAVEFYNGIIIPGFVNCHCHLELSHMRDMIPPKNGLAEFLRLFRTGREADMEKIITSASLTDSDMFNDGIVLCADVCNNDSTFSIKKRSKIKYISLLEIFGIDPDKAIRRMNEIYQVADNAKSIGLPYSLVPHSVYSISLTLFSLILAETRSNKVTSVHFMETRAEKMLLENREGPLMDSYKESELVKGDLETVRDHATAVLQEITDSGNLILVHNTYTDRATIRKVKKRRNLFWCLCPNANLYIEDHLPPLDLLMEENCPIVIGTDSLASNHRLSILEELKTLQKFFPSVPLSELILWATLNGAKALGEEALFGTIQPGKKPGLLLLQDIDLHKMRLLPESYVTRLI
jgi:cytosine/adenosine deaminase-related metal-dependent hydrolase